MEAPRTPDDRFASLPGTTIAGAGHFLQEDKGEALARVVVDFVARTSAA